MNSKNSVSISIIWPERVCIKALEKNALTELVTIEGIIVTVQILNR